MNITKQYIQRFLKESIDQDAEDSITDDILSEVANNEKSVVVHFPASITLSLRMGEGSEDELKERAAKYVETMIPEIEEGIGMTLKSDFGSVDATIREIEPLRNVSPEQITVRD